MVVNSLTSPCYREEPESERKREREPERKEEGEKEKEKVKDGVRSKNKKYLDPTNKVRLFYFKLICFTVTQQE